MEQKYSISEIDRMRAAIDSTFPRGSSYSLAEVENRLRTHMLNGTTPKELEADAMEKAKQRMADLTFYMKGGNS